VSDKNKGEIKIKSKSKIKKQYQEQFEINSIVVGQVASVASYLTKV